MEASGTTTKKMSSSTGMMPPISRPTVRSGSMLQCPVAMAQTSQITKRVKGIASARRSRFQRLSTRVRRAISSHAEPRKMKSRTPR